MHKYDTRLYHYHQLTLGASASQSREPLGGAEFVVPNRSVFSCVPVDRRRLKPYLDRSVIDHRGRLDHDQWSIIAVDSITINGRSSRSTRSRSMVDHRGRLCVDTTF
ncbi:hypothetical protein M8J77_016955 [Diaphorina citri]|nr:hypothetical protein M8J77_016955 [Diaphorina citri]